MNDHRWTRPRTSAVPLTPKNARGVAINFGEDDVEVCSGRDVVLMKTVVPVTAVQKPGTSILLIPNLSNAQMSPPRTIVPRKTVLVQINLVSAKLKAETDLFSKMFRDSPEAEAFKL